MGTTWGGKGAKKIWVPSMVLQKPICGYRATWRRRKGIFFRLPEKFTSDDKAILFFKFLSKKQ